MILKAGNCDVLGDYCLIMAGHTVLGDHCLIMAGHTVLGRLLIMAGLSHSFPVFSYDREATGHLRSLLYRP